MHSLQQRQKQEILGTKMSEQQNHPKADSTRKMLAILRILWDIKRVVCCAIKPA